MKRPARVLLVDDREAVRQTLGNILVDFDCRFSEAESGARALELLQENDFDVTFIDLRLPDISGIEVLRKAQELGKAAGKVIVLTGLPEQETQARASALGAFKYLTKNPVDWTQVRSAFAEAISDPRPPGLIDAHMRRVSRPRLLVLDDQQSWLDTIAAVLGHDLDLTLTTSANEACRRVRREHFNLVVLDMRLVGGVSGLDVLDRMRKIVPDLPAIILTGHPEYRSALDTGRRGVLDYVSKGELTALTGAVRRVLTEETKPIRIFLSYDKADSAKVSHLFGKLMSHGFLPWMDVKSIASGQEWALEVRKAIDQSDYFIFCLSRHSVYKEGIMRKELKQAWERQQSLLEGSIFFITVRLEDCEVVEPFNAFQYVDLFKRNGFRNLLQVLSSEAKSDE